MVGDLWDNIAEKDIPVTVAEKKFVKGRIDNLASRNYKTRYWGSIKSQMGLNK